MVLKLDVKDTFSAHCKGFAGGRVGIKETAPLFNYLPAAPLRMPHAITRSKR
jgi:hypothetical protein